MVTPGYIVFFFHATRVPHVAGLMVKVRFPQLQLAVGCC